MAQPRLQFAMAADGLLPPRFAHMDDGNLTYGTLVAGSLSVAIATCIPFTYLNDLISAGILVAFSMTDASVILLRQTSPANRPLLLEKLLVAFNVLSFTMGLLLEVGTETLMGKAMSALNILTLVAITFIIAKYCPRQPNGDDSFFETPLVPYLPLFAQFLNWYLIGQLEAQGILMLLGYLGLAIVFYFVYGANHSFGNTVGWNELQEVIGAPTGVGTEVRSMISAPERDDDISAETEDRYEEDDDISIGTPNGYSTTNNY